MHLSNSTHIDLKLDHKMKWRLCLDDLGRPKPTAPIDCEKKKCRWTEELTGGRAHPTPSLPPAGGGRRL